MTPPEVEVLNVSRLVRDRARYRAERDIARECVDRDGETIRRLKAAHNLQVDQIKALEADLAQARERALAHGREASKAAVLLLEVVERVRDAYPAWSLFSKETRR